MEESDQFVVVHIYDLSQGMANMMSQMLIGRHIEGIWHTAVVIFGREYFYGGQGIQACPPGGTVLGKPHKIENIGQSFIPYQVFKDYLRGLAESTFRGSNYNLLRHNCNTFTEDICQFLCGASIPKYILDLPQDVLSTPIGQSIVGLIDSLSGSQSTFAFEPQVSARNNSPGFDELNTEIEEARIKSLALDEKRKEIKEKIAKKERKKEKKRRQQHVDFSGVPMSELESEVNNSMPTIREIPSEMLPSEQVLEEEAAERAREEEKKRNREPPIIFSNIDPKVELEKLVPILEDKISPEDKTAIEELHQYLIDGEGSWALNEEFLIFVGKILRGAEFSSEARVHLLRTLACAALRDDIILILHQDRREHTLMNFIQDVDTLKAEEQEALGLFVCNLFEHPNPSEWLLYISEWAYNNQQTSNIRATTKIAVHCLLGQSDILQDIGSAIIHNLACKEVKTVVFDDVAVELAMALLQFFNNKPKEEYLWRAMKALARFIQVSADIPQLVQMIGPHPGTFKGTSPRIDELIDQISKKIR